MLALVFRRPVRQLKSGQIHRLRGDFGAVEIRRDGGGGRHRRGRRWRRAAGSWRRRGRRQHRITYGRLAVGCGVVALACAVTARRLPARLISCQASQNADRRRRKSARVPVRRLSIHGPSLASWLQCGGGVKGFTGMPRMAARHLRLAPKPQPLPDPVFLDGRSWCIPEQLGKTGSVYTKRTDRHTGRSG